MRTLLGRTLVADASVSAGGAGASLLTAPQRIYDTRDGTGRANGPIETGTRSALVAPPSEIGIGLPCLAAAG